MKHYQRFFTLLMAIFLSHLPYYSFSQICNPTESWLDTSYPGMGMRAFTEMNGNLYTIDYHVLRQEYVLFMYDGFQWTEMSAIPIGAPQSQYYDLETFQGEIYLGGSFLSTQVQIPNGGGIVRWDSATNTWSDVGGGVDGFVFAMEVYQNELYVGGNFDIAGGSLVVKSMTTWDGNSWDTLKDQTMLDPDTYVQDLITWDNKLIMGGDFNTTGFSHLAQYDTLSGWSGMGASPNNYVDDLAIYNGDLVVSGLYIDTFGTQSINLIARWDGSSWHSMGMSGTNDFVDINYMIEYNGDLWVTGRSGLFSLAGGTIPFDGMARWDGTQWNTVTGFNNTISGNNGTGHALKVYNNRLFLGGEFMSSCNNPIGDVVKLCSMNECQAVSGTVFQDDNNNCIQESGEWPMNQHWVDIGGNSVLTDTNGYYSFLVDTGSFNVNINSLSNYYTASCPTNGYNLVLNATTSGATNLDFGLTPTSNVEDLSVSITTFFFRPGFNTRIYLDYKNEGTVAQTPQIDLTHDALLSFTGIGSPATSSQSANIISWLPGSVAPSQTGGVWAEVNTPITANLGDTVCNSVWIMPIANDMTPTNNSDTSKSVITGSYDPNDKQVNPKGEGENGDIPLETEMLTYKIRFQNTGTDTAFTVVIRDELDENFDMTTLSTLGASHTWSFEIEEDRRVKWTFNNIFLPDSNTNEPASHGYISYSIELKENLPINTRIENTAGIYFDFNSPIITNTTINTLVIENTSADELIQLSKLKVWPQPASDWINFESEKPVFNAQIDLFDLQGRKMSVTRGLSGKRFRVPVFDLPRGVYVFRLIDGNGIKVSGKLVID